MENPRSPFHLAKYLSEEIKAGKSKKLLSKNLSLSLDYLNKHLWLHSWPAELVQVCELYSDIFTPRILFNTFASRKKYFTMNGFEHLRKEITLFVKNGAKHSPRKALNYPKSRAGGSLQMQRIRQESNKKSSLVHKKMDKEAESFDFVNLLHYQQLFKDLIGMHVVVQYSNKRESGEVRINFKNEKELEYLMDRMK